MLMNEKRNMLSTRLIKLRAKVANIMVQTVLVYIVYWFLFVLSLWELVQGDGCLKQLILD